MSEVLPEGWNCLPLGEVAEIKGGIQKGKKRNEGTVVRKVPYLRVANVQRGYLDLSEVSEVEATEKEIEALKLRAGDVLLNEGGDPDKLGRGWVWQDELPLCIHQNHVFRARPHPSKLDPQFLSLFANGPGQKYFLKQAKQTTGIASISSKQIHAFPVIMPGLDEQRRIVARIEELTTRSKTAKQALQAIPPLLEKFRQSVLAAAFRGDLTADWRREQSRIAPAKQVLESARGARIDNWKSSGCKGKAPELELPDSSLLPPLPSGWCWATPELMAAPTKYSLAIGPFGSNLVKSDYRESGTPVIFVRHIREKAFNTNPIFVDPEKAEELRAHTAAPGDVLITKMGDPPGDTWVHPEYLPKAVITADCIKFTPCDGIDPEYLSLTLLSPFTKKAILTATKGVAHQKISLETFRKVPVALAPYEEQAAIVLRVAQALSTVDGFAAENFERIETLERSILAKAFRGELDMAMREEHSPMVTSRQCSPECRVRHC